MDLAPGLVVGDRYVVEAPIGRGGMAVVYRVRHVTLGTFHALKVLLHGSAAIQERLLREGRVQGRLVHPNVVGVTDAIEVRGSPALVLELVDGPTLAALLAQRRLTLDQIDLLAAGILSGVGAAHQVGLIHRDLKPANVLLALTPQGLVPKVADFGLARVLDDDAGGRRTRTGSGMGTPQHMAPEQVRDAKDVDERADVWALGTVLYELATGRPAFEDPDRLALFLAIAEARATPVAELRPDLPGRMVRAITSALTADRDARPRDAAELLRFWAPTAVPAADHWSADIVGLARSLSPSATTAPPTPEPADRPGTSSSRSGPTVSDNRTWIEPAATTPAVRLPGLRSPDALRAWPTYLAVVTLGIAAMIVLALATRPPASVTDPPPPPPPAGSAPTLIPEITDHAVRILETATAELLDGRIDAASQHAESVAAGFDDARPDLVTMTADLVERRWGSAEESLVIAMRRPSGGDRAQAIHEGRLRPDRIAAWLGDHPDDWIVAYAGLHAAFATGDDRLLALSRFRAAAGARAFADVGAAQTLLAVGDLAGARRALEAWRTAVPDDPLVDLAEARLLVAEERTEEAADVLDRLAALKHPPSGTHEERARVALALGRRSDYDQSLSRIEGSAADPRIDGLLALARAHAGRGEIARCRELQGRAADVARRFHFGERLAEAGFERAMTELWLGGDQPGTGVAWIEEGAAVPEIDDVERGVAMTLRSVAGGLVAAGEGRGRRLTDALGEVRARNGPPAAIAVLEDAVERSGRGDRSPPADLGWVGPLRRTGCARTCDPLGLGRMQVAEEAVQDRRWADFAAAWPSADPQLPLMRRAAAAAGADRN